ncbi:hypothetical protein AB0K87_36760, partial [Streptomyces sp. NPDC053705]|uniref:hypothetical protein n=1 Tax=Streptomyces sp. NPDC053705 TaxID=3156668 RepID=UPI00342458BE
VRPDSGERLEVRGRHPGHVRLRATLAPRSSVRVIWALSERRAELGRRWSARVGRERWAARLRRPSRQQG